MRYERLLTHKSSALPTCNRLGEFRSVWQLLVLLYALLATLALWTLVQAPPGIQHLLLLCLLRLSVLLCVGAVTYQAHRRRRSLSAAADATLPWPSSLPTSGTSSGASSACSSHPATPRTTLAQAALYLQLAWLASEVVLGSALFFYPALLGPLAASATTAGAAGTLLAILPLLCALVMSGCFLFLQRLAGRRRRRQQRSPSPSRLDSAASCAALSSLPPGASSCHLDHSSVDVICSPASDSGSFSSCTSSASSAAFYSRSSSIGLGGSGGMPSPTGHVRSSSEGSAAQHAAVVQAACQILLVEHQLDTKEYCLFVHKRLRPIKTRPQDKSQPAQQPGLLRELITNSFTFQHDPELASQLQASVQVAAGGAGSSAASGATSITFQTAAAAASSLVVM